MLKHHISNLLLHELANVETKEERDVLMTDCPQAVVVKHSD